MNIIPFQLNLWTTTRKYSMYVYVLRQKRPFAPVLTIVNFDFTQKKYHVSFTFGLGKKKCYSMWLAAKNVLVK